MYLPRLLEDGATKPDRDMELFVLTAASSDKRIPSSIFPLKFFKSGQMSLYQEGAMVTHTCVPVAQYLRMSTEHQQYSLEHQSAAIRK
jgi:hypothetical protein